MQVDPRVVRRATSNGVEVDELPDEIFKDFDLCMELVKNHPLVYTRLVRLIEEGGDEVANGTSPFCDPHSEAFLDAFFSAALMRTVTPPAHEFWSTLKRIPEALVAEKAFERFTNDTVVRVGPTTLLMLPLAWATDPRVFDKFLESRSGLKRFAHLMNLYAACLKDAAYQTHGLAHCVHTQLVLAEPRVDDAWVEVVVNAIERLFGSVESITHFMDRFGKLHGSATCAGFGRSNCGELFAIVSPTTTTSPCSVRINFTAVAPTAASVPSIGR